MTQLRRAPFGEEHLRTQKEMLDLIGQLVALPADFSQFLSLVLESALCNLHNNQIITVPKVCLGFARKIWECLEEDCDERERHVIQPTLDRLTYLLVSRGYGAVGGLGYHSIDSSSEEEPPLIPQDNLPSPVFSDEVFTDDEGAGSEVDTEAEGN